MTIFLIKKAFAIAKAFLFPSLDEESPQFLKVLTKDTLNF